jgi:hypothetical protein
MPGQQQRTTSEKTGEAGAAATNSTENGRKPERQTPSCTPRPREPTVNDNININVNPGNKRQAHQQQQQQKTTTYATVLQTANDGNGGWNLVQDKTTARREREHNN